MHLQLIDFVRDIYQTKEFIPLHAPIFTGNEKNYINATIDSTFVSSVGKFVDDFEAKVAAYTGAAKAVATVNGTAALHAALYLADVRPGDLVLTQALTFVATCNAIHHLGAQPVFIDIEFGAFGLCPIATENWLSENAQIDADGQCRHKTSGARIQALVPMHTFGLPAQLDGLIAVTKKWHLTLIEDAAESLGSYYLGQHTGTLGDIGVLSFNGNKIITTGGGGMLLCHTAEQGTAAKHITTTAKIAHPYEFFHDQPGFNYRMPNLNAALGCAQMERLDALLKSKRNIAKRYQGFFAGSEYKFIQEPNYGKANYWLNAIYCPSPEARVELLKKTNAAGVMTRPVWQLMHRLPMYENCLRGELINAEQAERHLLNVPSSALLSDML